ncbi:MAG: hypothetical protein VX464_11680 [Pseudomonadota bacterium]|nr:hypothetical protein [Pseudomonadota bacterium]
MRRPARAAGRAAKITPTTIPAPIGGWNARDAIDLMQPTDAIVLDNWYPDETEVALRRGYSLHGTPFRAVDFGSIASTPTETEDLGSIAIVDDEDYDLGAIA